MTLRARIQRLERFTLPWSIVLELWVEVTSYDPVQAGRGTTQAKCGDRAWTRQAGEVEEGFPARVAAEVSGRSPRLSVCADGDHAPWPSGGSSRA